MTSRPRSTGICPKCGNVTDTTSHYCEHCAADLSQIRNQAQTENSESSAAKSLKKRYWDAYVVARTTVGIGRGIKFVGALLGILIFLGFLLAASNTRTLRGSDAPIIGAVVGGASGLFVWLIFFIWGVLVSAQGQILKASLDGAVNSSPFLDNEQRARIMSL